MECKPGSFPSSATLRLLPLALGLLTASLTLQAQPRFAPRPPAARLGAESRPLPVEALIEAALVFSDAPADYLTAGKARFGALIDAFAARPRAADPPRGTAEDILTFMHETVLGRYEENVTEMHVLLEQGVYNCVSSAMLYLILAKSAGLDVIGMKTRDHVFCSVRLAGENIDVETTNVYGFDPGSKTEFLDAFGKVTGYSYVPPTNYRDRTETDAKGLLALLLHNRVSFLTEKREFSDAIGAAVDAYALLRDKGSLDKLVMTVVNQSSWHNSRRRYEAGLSLLNDAIAAFGPDERVVAARGDLVHNWVVELLDRGNMQDAADLAQQQLASGGLDESDWRKFMVFIYQARAREAAERREYLEATAVIDEALVLLGSDRGLLRNRQVYRRNFEVGAHNAMVTAFNARDYSKARVIIEKALERLPDSETLRQDLELITEALSSGR